MSASYANYIIYACGVDNATLSNIMWVPGTALEKIRKYTDVLNIDYNNKFDRKYCIEKYGEDDFDEIYKKLSEIKKFVNTK